jgi:hypothetical protein
LKLNRALSSNGSTAFTLYSPTTNPAGRGAELHVEDDEEEEDEDEETPRAADAAEGPPLPNHAVALQPVAFERQILKPFFHLIGFRLWF